MKETFKYWQQAFPNLKKIGANKFFKTVGPILIGIEMVKSSYGDEYKPYLVVCTFWNKGILKNELESTLKRRLSSPNIYLSLKKDNGLEFNLGYYDTKLIPEASFQIKKQFLPLGRNIKVEELFDYLDSYRYKSKASSTAAGMAFLLEFKYLVSLYLNASDLMNKILQEIEENSRMWDMSHFEYWIGDYTLWIQKLKNLSREELMDSMNSFKNDPKIQRLKSFEIIKEKTSR
jgi:hypothetical protein